jgi:hypothetical protein
MFIPINDCLNDPFQLFKFELICIWLGGLQIFIITKNH